MKVHSLTILHYGADYLSYALRSVYHSVDKLHIFYTPTPSHGHTTNYPPLETKQDLMYAAYAYDPDNKVIWYDTHNIYAEGMQRDLALETVKNAGAELVVVVDCDEIWQRSVLELMLSIAWEENNAHHWLVNMVHFWRSFNYACQDNGWPVRIIDLRHLEGVRYLQKELGQVFHFGYAVSDLLMNYKWQIHGHKSELRPNWFSTYWSTWPPIENCHPTNGRNSSGIPFWNPEPFDKNKLPEFMRNHPFWSLEKIE